MQRQFCVLVLIGNSFLSCYGLNQVNEASLLRASIIDSDTTIVNLDQHGDTLAVYLFSDSSLSEKRHYYAGNRLRMIRRYKDGFLFNVDRSLNAKGKPVYPGTFSMGTGSIIEYTSRGRIESIEYWSNYEMIYVEYYGMKGIVKRVFYSNGIPINNIITRIDGRVLSKTTYESDGVTVKRTEYFDEDLNVSLTLYGH